MSRKLSVLIGAIALTATACNITREPIIDSDRVMPTLSPSSSKPVEANSELSASEPEASDAGSQVVLRESSVQEVLDRLIDSCEPETEISYRSQTLVSPDGSVSAQSEGTLRGTLPPDSSYCLGDRETYNRQIVLEDQIRSGNCL